MAVAIQFNETAKVFSVGGGDVLEKYVAEKYLTERLEALYLRFVTPRLAEADRPNVRSLANEGLPERFTREGFEETIDHKISFYLLMLSIGPGMRASERAHRYSLNGKDGRDWDDFYPYVKRAGRLLAHVILSNFAV